MLTKNQLPQFLLNLIITTLNILFVADKKMCFVVSKNVFYSVKKTAHFRLLKVEIGNTTEFGRQVAQVARKSDEIFHSLFKRLGSNLIIRELKGHRNFCRPNEKISQKCKILHQLFLSYMTSILFSV